MFYLSNRLPIHRSKLSAADELWNKHLGTLFKPVAEEKEFRTFTIHKEMDKMDIVVDGLGWACVHG